VAPRAFAGKNLVMKKEIINRDTEKTRIQDAAILTGILLLIVKSEYYWKQIVGLIPLVIKVALVLLALAVGIMIIVSVARIFKERPVGGVRKFIPAGIYFVGLLFSFADPFPFNAESFQSQVVLRGHFNATMNTAIIKFRQNGRVEFEGTGFLGYSYFYSGSWTKRGDTLTTIFADDAPIPWGKQLFLDINRFLLLPSDSVAQSQHFPGFLLDSLQNIQIKSLPMNTSQRILYL
jgi:hypothetical protein